MSHINTILQHLQSASSNTAIVDSRNQYSYEQLSNNVGRILTLLQDTPKQSPVFIWEDNGFHSISTILACLASGRTFVPLSKKAPLDYIQHQLSNFSEGTILTSTQYIQALQARNSFFSNLLVKDIECDANAAPIIISDAEESIPAYVLFTSGSSGPAKAVAISRKNLEAFLTSVHKMHDFSDKDRFLNFSRLTFDLSLFDILACFSSQGTLFVIDNDRDYLNPIPFIAKHQINIALLVPSSMRLINSIYENRHCPQLSFKKVFFCGEKLLPSDLTLLKSKGPSDCSYYNWYGPTEATIACFEKKIETSSSSEQTISIGQPFPLTNYTVELENDYLPKKAGELVIISEQVSTFGYLGTQDPKFSDQSNIRAYRTGDLVEIKDDEVYWLGRIDNQIKRNGIRVDLDEAEEVLTKFLQTTVYLIERDLKVIAFIASAKKSKDDYETILIKSLPPHLRPDQLMLIDTIPTNDRGKVDRKALSRLISL